MDVPVLLHSAHSSGAELFRRPPVTNTTLELEAEPTVSRHAQQEVILRVYTVHEMTQTSSLQTSNKFLDLQCHIKNVLVFILSSIA
jgi:hypothetical protein